MRNRFVSFFFFCGALVMAAAGCPDDTETSMSSAATATGSGGAGGGGGGGGAGGGGGEGGSGGLGGSGGSAPPGDPIWSKSFGGTTTQYGHDVAVDPSGNVILTGTFRDSIDFGGGELMGVALDDIYLTKLDAKGAHVWSKGFAAADDQYVTSATTDPSGNIFICGAFTQQMDFGAGPLTSAGSYDIFLAKFDPAGKLLWSKGFGAGGWDVCGALATDASGNVIATGSFGGTVNFGGGMLDAQGIDVLFLLKLDAMGGHVLSKAFAGATSPAPGAVTVGSAGNIFLIDEFEGTVDVGGGPYMSSAGGRSVLVAKLDPNGGHIWSKAFGGGGFGTGTGIAVSAAGDVHIAGNFSGVIDFGKGAMMSAGGFDVFAAKLDSAGAVQWNKRFGDADKQITRALVVSPKGTMILTGPFGGSIDFGGGALTVTGGDDLFVAALDASGAHVFSKKFGVDGLQEARGLVSDASGNLLFTGAFNGNLDFGNGPLAQAGLFDVFVAKLGPVD